MLQKNKIWLAFTKIFSFKVCSFKLVIARIKTASSFIQVIKNILTVVEKTAKYLNNLDQIFNILYHYFLLLLYYTFFNKIWPATAKCLPIPAQQGSTIVFICGESLTLNV